MPANRKKIYIYSVHHMDLIWQRGWNRCHVDETQIIRSYEDLEERQILCWMKLINQNAKIRHSIEQTQSLRMFCARNPDLKQILKRQIDEEKLIIDGGGEAIIDTNMVSGESIVRNHLYSILWLKEQFDYRPKISIATDTFGLSAQLPQIFRGLGYDAMVIHNRVFDNSAPLWRGLDGSTLYIVKLFAEPEQTRLVAKWHAFCNGVECGCRNHGCEACAGAGIIHNGIGNTDPDKLKPLFEEISESKSEYIVLYLCSEWQMPSPSFLDSINSYAEKYGCELHFATLPKLRNDLPTPIYDRFLENCCSEDDFVDGNEGNPVCTGCYLSRIKLKQQNRELEARLYTAETWSAVAAEFGYIYPRKKLAYLWNLMSFTQFHDAITGPHTDACYEDLLSAGIEIRNGACLLADDAVSILAENISAEEKPGYLSFSVFNPLAWDAKEFPIKIWLELPEYKIGQSLEIIDSNGKKMTVISIEYQAQTAKAELIFSGAELPALGYTTFYYRQNRMNLTSTSKNIAPGAFSKIENHNYRITLKANGIGEIFDKKLDQLISHEGFADLIMEEDYGSPWETLAKPYFNMNLNDSWIKESFVRTGNGFSAAVFVGQCRDPRLSRDRNIHDVSWTQTVTLFDELPGIHVHTELEWDSENARIALRVPLAFQSADDSAFYEIPFGMMQRKAYEPRYGIHTEANGDWPALNSIVILNETDKYTVSLCNRGLPCHRISNGEMIIGLTRSPQIPVYISNYRGAKDPGPHVFETVIFSDDGDIGQSLAVQRGMEYNAKLLAVPCRARTGRLPLTHSFLPEISPNIAISAVKRAETNDDLIIRAWEIYGNHVPNAINWPGNKNLKTVNFLEEDEEGKSISDFKPHEIKTIRGEAGTILSLPELGKS